MDGEPSSIWMAAPFLDWNMKAMASPRIHLTLGRLPVASPRASPLVVALLVTALVTALVTLASDAAALDGARPDSGPEQYDSLASSRSGEETITVETLYANERFWPYRIQLVEPWKPVGFEGRFGFGVGVLIRVEPSGLLRVDFAENGVHQVPAGATDAVARANLIRQGQADKSLPNLVLWLSGRLLDPTRTPIRPLEKLEIDGARAFLIVVADPAGPEFAPIARDLEAVRERPGLLTLLMPQGPHRDGGVVNLCRAADWEHSFLLDRLSPAYTRSLLDPALVPPVVLLLSAEGLLIHGSRWIEGSGEILESIVDSLWSSWSNSDPSAGGGGETS